MPKTLLLADDSVVIQKLVGLSFANEDVELVTTDNGDDAVAKARERKPDIVLADVVMPGMSGYEVCEAIKSDPELSSTPVILLTGTFEAFDEARARSAGSDGHITKPFEAQALVDRVNDLLSRAPAPKPAAAAPPQNLEVFDSAPAAGQDVTRAAPQDLLDPLAPPATPSPLSADAGFDIGGEGSGLPPLRESDPLAGPLDLGATPQPEPIVTSEAEDDLLSTPNPILPESPTVTQMPPEREPQPAAPAVEATPRLETPPPAPEPPAPAEPAPPPPVAAADDLMGGDQSDPSLTTIIMSDGESSSDGIALGAPEAPVRSLDEDASPAAAAENEKTMLADDLFTSQPRSNSDSGFDFGTAGDASSPDLSPTALAGDPADSSPMLGRDPLATPPSPPPAAQDYDVSSSELVDPVYPPADPVLDPLAAAAVEPADDATVFAPVAEEPTPEPVVEAAPIVDDIALSDGLLGEPIQAEPEPEPAPAAAPAAASAGPDITPVMRDRIHETLERVAWEAFADLPETLIKQVVERVEAIAWEVIPQMAEALIKEEIRRMKGDSE